MFGIIVNMVAIVSALLIFYSFQVVCLFDYVSDWDDAWHVGLR